MPSSQAIEHWVNVFSKLYEGTDKNRRPDQL